MSALVGYDSSSDEEKPAKPASTLEASVTPTDAANDSGHPAGIEINGSHRTVSGAAMAGPLLGPMPLTNGGARNADSPETFENMSDRDTIRYLSQAPVPMTSMPSSPPGSPDPVANARFARFQQLKAKGVHFNEDLAKKSSFLNPGLLATMMTRAGIDLGNQYNTSLPLDLWNPKGFPKWAYKEELLKSQQEIRDKDDAAKQALSAAGKRAIDFAPSGGDSGDSSRRYMPSNRRKRRKS